MSNPGQLCLCSLPGVLMKVGDLVKLNDNVRKCKGMRAAYSDKVYLIVETMTLSHGPSSLWLKLDGPEGWVTSGWTPSEDYEVVNESG